MVQLKAVKVSRHEWMVEGGDLPLVLPEHSVRNIMWDVGVGFDVSSKFDIVEIRRGWDEEGTLKGGRPFKCPPSSARSA